MKILFVLSNKAEEACLAKEEVTDEYLLYDSIYVKIKYMQN